jgi:sirohydrochlorin ferrochelatase
MADPPALLLIAHGSRRPAANADARWLAAELVKRGPYQIAVAAFLELAEPDIAAGAAACVARGATRVVLLPHFLSPGVHVQRDLRAARRRLARLHPEVEFVLAEPIGRHPLLVDILAARAGAVGAEPTT